MFLVVVDSALSSTEERDILREHDVKVPGARPGHIRKRKHPNPPRDTDAGYVEYFF